MNAYGNKVLSNARCSVLSNHVLPQWENGIFIRSQRRAVEREADSTMSSTLHPVCRALPQIGKHHALLRNCCGYLNLMSHEREGRRCRTN